VFVVVAGKKNQGCHGASVGANTFFLLYVVKIGESRFEIRKSYIIMLPPKTIHLFIF
jgi:hypothetical protein